MTFSASGTVPGYETGTIPANGNVTIHAAGEEFVSIQFGRNSRDVFGEEEYPVKALNVKAGATVTLSLTVQ